MQLRLIALIFAGIAFGTAASAASAASPASPGQETIRYLRAKMAEQGVPAVQVAVAKKGKIVFEWSAGEASVELRVPATSTSIFSVNSIAKSFTGVAAMQLVEQQRLNLDAPISTYLGDLPPAWRNVRVRQLLSHMSGLPDVTRAPTVETDAKAAWTWVQQQPVRFQPGERFDYCQTNYTLLLKIINRLRAQDEDAPIALQQFATARMTHTAYGDSTDLITGKASSYRWDRSKTGTPPMLRPAIERFLPFRRASSGLNASASDLAQWAIALQTGKLLKPETVEQLWREESFTSGQKGQWGLGWQILRRSTHRAVGMTGGGRAAFYIYPEYDVTVVVLTNLAGAFPEDWIDSIAARFVPSLTLDGIPALRLALEQKGYANAALEARRLSATPGNGWREAELNDWAYRLLSTGRTGDALPIFELNVKLYPSSGNAHDSLGEALLARGQRDAALAAYRKALSLDPGNSHAATMIAKIEPGLR